MTDINFVSRPTAKHSVTLVSALATAAAGAAACAVGLVTFPFLAGTPAGPFLPAILATAVLVASPICLFLIRMISRMEGQRRDLHAREVLLTTAQRFAKLGYWHYDVKTSRITLSDNLHDLLGDPDGTLDLTLSVLLGMAPPDEREMLQRALERIIVDGTCEQIEYRITGLDGINRTFWVDGQRIVDAIGKPIRAYGACQDITDQKAIEAALRESEDHYRHAVELNPQMPWTADSQGNILEIGPRWVELMGMTREESLGQGWAVALHPEDEAPLHQYVSKCLANSEPMDIEVRFRVVGGSYRWFRLRSFPRRDDQGVVVRWYGTTDDINDRKIVDAALRESEAFSRSILDSSTDCVKVIDLEGHLQFMNGPGLRIMEIEDYQIVRGRSWDELWPEESRDKVRQAVETARTGGLARFAAFCPTAKGTRKWWDVSVSAITGPDGRPARLLATSRDMTDSKLAQDELTRARQKAEEAAQRLTNVLESTTDSVFILDRDWRFSYLNPQAIELISGGRDLLGQNIWEAFPGAVGSKFEESYREAVTSQRPVDFEEFYAPLGMWLQVHAYPSADGLSVFFRDVTERHNAQEEIKRGLEEAKAASHAKSAFLATMSHEIRTPMNGVLGLAEQLSLTEMDSDQNRMLDELRNSGSALLTIINDILDFSKIEAGKISVNNQPADLRAAVKALEPMFRPEAEAGNLEFSVNVDEALSDGHLTDVGRLRQILTNCVGNAIKFTESGSVHLEVRCGPVRGGRQAVTFAVSDTGIGIAAAELDRIFMPFEQVDPSTTRRFGGTGLGLAISNRIATAMGGEIRVESRVGRGSTFTLSLDLQVVSADKISAKAKASKVLLPDISGARVLVADDNTVNRLLMSHVLRNAGCIGTLVETGHAAIQATACQDFDIVLMDISMPEMDGYEATRAIRKREERDAKPMLPIVALTAHVGENYRRECLLNGMQGMLSKPFRREDIMKTIAAHTRAGRHPAQEASVAV